MAMQREMRVLTDEEILEDPIVAHLWDKYRRHASTWRTITPENEAEGRELMVCYGRALRQIQGRDVYRPETPQEHETLGAILNDLRTLMGLWENPGNTITK